MFCAIAQNEEYTIKAVYIEKITRFVTWPDSLIAKKTEPVIFAIYGHSEMTEVAEQLYQNYKIKGKEVKIKIINDLNEINSADILFISKTSDDEVERILEILDNKPILTIGDTKKYAKKGVMINFVILDDRIKFEINKTSVDKALLHFNHLLLKQAEKIIM